MTRFLIGTFIAVTLSLSTSCAGVKNYAKDAISECGEPLVAQVTASLVPQVQAALIGGAPDWKMQLDGLRVDFGVALLCAVKVAVVDFTTAAPSAKAVMASSAPSATTLAAGRGRAYLDRVSP